jgi:myo-inositol 2-dehydrogenase/D-chiro-inositol 1-dehydrogenase
MGQTHLAALKVSETVAVTAIVDPRESVAETLRREGYTVFDSIGALLDAGGADGFLIATPSGFHLEAIRQLAPAGLPILCEKPCGLTVEDASAVKEIVTAAGVRLHVGYWRRFVPQLVALKKDIDAGVLGRLLLVHASQWDHRPPAAEFRNTSGGILTDMGVHEIDVIQWLTGAAIVSLTGLAMMSDAEGVVDEDAATYSMALSTGVIGIATLGRFYPGADVVGFEVMGDKGHARIDVLTETDGEQVQMDALREQAEAFARGDSANAATIDDALSALRVVSLSRESSH